MMPARRNAYTVTIPKRSLATLEWLAARGYDGGFLRLAEPTDDENGTFVQYGLTESEAWVFASNVESDGHTFLTCNADTDLADALNGLLERIV